MGAAPEGVTGAHFVATNDLTEYICKANSFCPPAVGPYVPANEMIAAQLAGQLEIPVLPWEFLELPGGELAFGSLKLSNAEFGPLTSASASQLVAPTLLEALAVFDLFIANTDRHCKNIVARKAGAGRYQVIANDHSHCLVRGTWDPSNLANVYETILQQQPSAFFSCQELVSRVRNVAKLRETTSKVESIGRGTLQDIVDGVPDAWMDHQVKATMVGFLEDRATNIRTLLNRVRGVFPNLGGAPI
ncbi:MAG: HipA family kinase [Dehalococcoidia bacterium]